MRYEEYYKYCEELSAHEEFLYFLGGINKLVSLAGTWKSLSMLVVRKITFDKERKFDAYNMILHIPPTYPISQSRR